MSFILDALKKSEAEHQQQASGEFSSIPTAVNSAAPPRWIWALGALLLLNILVLIALTTRGKDHDKLAAIADEASGETPSAAAPGLYGPLKGSQRRTGAPRSPCRRPLRREHRRRPEFAGSAADTRRTSTQRGPGAPGYESRYPCLRRIANRPIRVHRYAKTRRRRSARERRKTRGNKPRRGDNELPWHTLRAAS